MRRYAKSALFSLVIFWFVDNVWAFDVEPYFEYEVAVQGYPTTYFTDVSEAAPLLMARYCEHSADTDCEFERIWYLNSIYLVDYWYTDRFGNRYPNSVWGYHYYTCATSPSLYITEHGVTRGPYRNRLVAPPIFGTAFCLDVSPETETEHQSDLGAGDCETRPNAGNPINVGLNNKYQEVIDIATTGDSPLTWSRYYNSGVVSDGKQTVPGTARLGSRWRGTYDRSLAIVNTKNGARVRLQRHTGERLDFVETDGRYRSEADPRGQLSRDGESWIYRSAAGETETYNVDGRLMSIDVGTSSEVRLRYEAALVEVTDLQGRKLSFVFDNVGRISSVSDSTGIAVTYAYAEGADTGLKADLVRATYTDGSFHEYLYNEVAFAGGDHPHVLTGIFDETRQRFATFRYDGEGRAIASEHWNGVGKVQLAREADGRTAVTGPTGSVHRYRYADVRGVKRLVSVDQPGGAGCAAASASIDYDDNGLVSRRVDFDGLATEYRHDSDGKELERTEAAGTAQARHIVTEWHPVLRRPIRITAPGHEDRFSYDVSGNLTGREVWAAIDPTQPDAPLTLSRVWRMTYDAAGRLVHEEGPRSDTSTIATLARHTYRTADASNCSTGPCDYRKGDLWKSENALGHVEEILSYDAAGRVRSRKDAQGTLFTTTYSPRGWVQEVKETRPDGIVATTTFTYTPRGDVASVTDADGVTMNFEYDAAGRLIQIANSSNHRLRFTLDAAGQRREEASYDLFLRTQLTRTFDALGRIETETREGATTRYTYDERGRPTSRTDADGRKDTTGYDPLGRLREAIRDVGGIGASSKATYDPLDQLTSVQDPKGLSTRYLATGLGDVGSVDSPDAGVSTDEHDATGEIVRHEGAGGVGSYRVTRDALGRPTLVNYDGGMNASYTYDTADTACPADQRYATGRLAAMTQGDSRTLYCYDAPGNVTRTIQRWATTTKTVSYRYSKAGRLEAVGIDGGAEVAYRYDADGSVTGVTVTPAGGAGTDLITSVAYRPFDLIESWRYGNGSELRVARDKSGRVTTWSGIDPDNSVYVLGYTPGGEIASQFGRWYGFGLGHDGLGYLDAVKDFNTGSELRQFDYTSAGDRTAMTAGGIRQTYLYDPASHRLTTAHGKSRRYDATGNTIGIGDATLTYDPAGRLASASEQGRVLVSYGYDAGGQRIVRTEASGTSQMMLYDESGRWLADYDSSGRISRQAVWMGDHLVGLVEGTKILYVEPDHLGTPRAVIDPTRNATIWRWRPSDDPFGSALPDEDPDADGTRFVFDLRFAGQRYDAVTGLHYNYRRDYDPESGRYIQVDPIGIAGGINPYLYAEASPLMYIDPLGLYPWGDPLPDWLVDGAAGLGDTLSFGGTRVIRRWMGTDGVVNRCSNAYGNGELGALGMSLAFGGAHLGRNAVYQMGRAGGLGNRVSRGVGRVFSDGRSWGATRDTWSVAAGSGKRWLASNGQSLHHWLIPQRFAKVNAGFNYMPISSGFNSWMNGSTALRTAVEWGFRGGVAGVYGAPVTAAFSGDDCTCQSERNGHR